MAVQRSVRNALWPGRAAFMLEETKPRASAREKTTGSVMPTICQKKAMCGMNVLKKHGGFIHERPTVGGT